MHWACGPSISKQSSSIGPRGPLHGFAMHMALQAIALASNAMLCFAMHSAARPKGLGLMLAPAMLWADGLLLSIAMLSFAELAIASTSPGPTSLLKPAICLAGNSTALLSISLLALRAKGLLLAIACLLGSNQMHGLSACVSCWPMFCLLQPRHGLAGHPCALSSKRKGLHFATYGHACCKHKHQGLRPCAYCCSKWPEGTKLLLGLAASSCYLLAEALRAVQSKAQDCVSAASSL